MNRENKKTFLEQLQLLDPPTKKKVLVTTTVIVAALVMYVWLGYFNNIIAGISENANASDASVPVNTTSPIGEIWGGVMNGTEHLYAGIAGGLHDIGNLFQSPRQYVVTPSK